MDISDNKVHADDILIRDGKIYLILKEKKLISKPITIDEVIQILNQKRKNKNK